MNSITENRDDRSRHGILSLFFLLLFLSPVGAQSTSEQTTDPYRYKFSPSMAIIIVILIAALFFMVVFSVYIRQCSNSQSANSILPVGNGAGIGRSRRAARGLDASVIETFPTMVYSVVKGLKIGKGALECAVCLNEFEDDETLRLIPKCDHVFHPDCIDAWLGSHTTCPVCRANLFPEPDEAVTQLSELDAELDIEAQPDIEQVRDGSQRGIGEQQREAEVVDLTKTLNRNRTRGGSRSNRSSNLGWLFPRSHSTGHPLVQPGENTERYTLRLPVEVRKQIMNRQLNRAMSMVVLPRESSSRRGYRVGGGGSSRGKHYKRIEESDRRVKSDRWAVSATSRFFTRMSSIKLPKVVNKDGEGTSSQENPLNDKGLRSSDS